MSTREIAPRLVVPVRTVENHLYRINTRLGISSRAELADVLGDYRDRPDRVGDEGTSELSGPAG